MMTTMTGLVMMMEYYVIHALEMPVRAKSLRVPIFVTSPNSRKEKAKLAAAADCAVAFGSSHHHGVGD